MFILIHVIIAISSLIVAALVLVRPSRRALTANYGLILATVSTGTYLLVAYPTHMLQSCMIGVGYLVAVSFATVAANVRLRKLAVATS